MLGTGRDILRDGGDARILGERAIAYGWVICTFWMFCEVIR
jgi:hypothetical protein